MKESPADFINRGPAPAPATKSVNALWASYRSLPGSVAGASLACEAVHFVYDTGMSHGAEKGWSAKVSAWILFAVVAAAPLPFG